MKTKEELNVLKEEVEALNKKLAELTEDELAQVSGGFVSQTLPHFHVHIIPRKIGDGLGNPGEWSVPSGAKEDVRIMYERLKIT